MGDLKGQTVPICWRDRADTAGRPAGDQSVPHDVGGAGTTAQKQAVLVEREGYVAVITPNRPERLSARLGPMVRADGQSYSRQAATSGKREGHPSQDAGKHDDSGRLDGQDPVGQNRHRKRRRVSGASSTWQRSGGRVCSCS